MNSLIPYLVFPGTCKEALEYYSEIFEGEILSIKTYKESPLKVSTEYENRIFDSEFMAKGVRFKASDDLPNHPVTFGNGISFFVSYRDNQTRSRDFSKLAMKGHTLFPLSEDFGMLKDKFGVQWMMVLEKI